MERTAVTEDHESAASRLLAEASRRLAGSFEPARELVGIARRTVPLLGDLCVVYLIEHGRLNRVAAIHVDRDLQPVLEALAPPGQESSIHDAMTVQRTVVVDEVDQRARGQLATTPADLMRLERLALRTVLVVPVIARGRAFGAIGFGRADPPRPYTEADVALAEELGRSIGLALDGARLLASARAAQRQSEEVRALLGAIYGAAPVGLGFLDTELCFRRVNPALAAVLGAPAEELVGRPLTDALPAFAAAIAPQLEHVRIKRESVRDVRMEGLVRDGDGRRRVLNTSYYPVADPAGDLLGIGMVCDDVTELMRAQSEREDLHERTRLLADVAAELDVSLDYPATLQRLAELLVRRMADWVSIEMPPGRSGPGHVAFAHVDPGRLARAQALHARRPADPGGRRGAPAVIRTGAPELYEDAAEALAVAAGEDPAAQELARALGVHSAMVVPLRARGRTLGAITLIAAQRTPRYGPAELDLVLELARRAALAIDNARLHHELREAAGTLQARMLPRLPTIPGVELAARYVPAGEGLTVGGDFYDAFALGERSWALAVGDVCGKGAEAAAVMALARYTIRALAPERGSPAATLVALNDALLREELDLRFVTVALVKLDLDEDGGGLVTVACAGHPPPILLPADGPPEALAGAGTLLGVWPDVELHDVRRPVHRGDAIALYTDGVIEAARPHRLPISELAAALHPLRAQSAEAIADRLAELGRHDPDRPPADDVAALVAKLA